ncbi:class I SAM-dependent methyltransferase [uncultured Bradyrhizobium sp.]|jgi:SAM-dependent methyltransferase|uniref:class I SAM-dependent methyltransferase n=1 Tax=uncultured Bradyrhizobium sp. TaxID=199684 RepID=UPI00261E2F4A|nr:class I SAM-dependent methyltransferase [uncultured Bradyrhizobium sp.]
MNTTSFENQYKRFEDRFRGSEDLVRQRLSIYLPLVNGLRLNNSASHKALDIGSGRGEWLALLSSQGWDVTGVEPNDIADASNKRCSVVRSDALDYLKTCKSQSYALVTAFHVVEHVGTDYLLDMMSEIRRVIAPGGLIILETPNPENMTVGWSFYVDPTHKNPLPPVLLQYFVEQAGFPAPEIVRLNGYEGDYELGPLSGLLSTLFRSGPDYSIVARSPTGQNDPFSLRIRDFAIQHSQRDPTDMRVLANLAATADLTIADHARQLEELRARQLGTEAALNQRSLELAAIYGSTSWRLTRPLRFLMRTVRRVSNLPGLRTALADMRLYLRERPQLKRKIVGRLYLVPALKRKIIGLTPHDEPRWQTDAHPRAREDWIKIMSQTEQR